MRVDVFARGSNDAVGDKDPHYSRYMMNDQRCLAGFEKAWPTYHVGVHAHESSKLFSTDALPVFHLFQNI